MARRIALFGLSADPPTGDRGHAGIVRWALERLGVDDVWVLPVYQHAFHEKQNMTPYAHRLAMAKLAFEHLAGLEGRVRVMEAERDTAAMTADWVGTIDVVKHLQSLYPGIAFELLMGGDTYRDYLQGKWKGGRQLETLLPISAVPRAGAMGGPGGELSIAPPQLGEVSSRVLRASADSEVWEREVSPEVRAYVRDHQLYRYGGASEGAPVL